MLLHSESFVPPELFPGLQRASAFLLAIISLVIKVSVNLICINPSWCFALACNLKLCVRKQGEIPLVRN